MLILVLGLALALLVGISLGLIGGGGSILTVPILVYVLGVEAGAATAYSLFIVGVTALVGSITYYRKGLVNLPTAVLFSVPSLISVALVRQFLMPNIPDEVFSIGSFVVSKTLLIMGVFALLMIAASFSMIRKGKPAAIKDADKPYTPPYLLIAVEGLVVGALTGFVGAGGGFLIIPALVVFARLDMKVAVGTSLLIIGTKSLLGFIPDAVGGKQIIDWALLLGLTAMAVIGIFIGSYLSRFVSGDKLKPAFGYFVLLMGIYILLKETLS